MKTEMKSVKKAPHKPLLSCPKCSSETIWRIERSLAERIIYLYSNGKYAAKKFLCKSCGSTYLIHRDGQPPKGTAAMRLEQDEEPLIGCLKCGKENMILDKVTAAEITRHQKETGKTAFRKLVCNNCSAETIIYQEDYDNAFRNEI